MTQSNISKHFKHILFTLLCFGYVMDMNAQFLKNAIVHEFPEDFGRMFIKDEFEFDSYRYTVMKGQYVDWVVNNELVASNNNEVFERNKLAIVKSTLDGEYVDHVEIRNTDGIDTINHIGYGGSYMDDGVLYISLYCRLNEIYVDGEQYYQVASDEVESVSAVIGFNSDLEVVYDYYIDPVSDGVLNIEQIVVKDSLLYALGQFYGDSIQVFEDTLTTDFFPNEGVFLTVQNMHAKTTEHVEQIPMGINQGTKGLLVNSEGDITFGFNYFYVFVMRGDTTTSMGFNLSDNAAIVSLDKDYNIKYKQVFDSYTSTRIQGMVLDDLDQLYVSGTNFNAFNEEQVCDSMQHQAIVKFDANGNMLNIHCDPFYFNGIRLPFYRNIAIVDNNVYLMQVANIDTFLIANEIVDIKHWTCLLSRFDEDLNLEYVHLFDESITTRPYYLGNSGECVRVGLSIYRTDPNIDYEPLLGFELTSGEHHVTADYIEDESYNLLTSIGEIQSLQEISIQPNPVCAGDLLKLPELQHVEYVVWYSLSGELIGTEALDSDMIYVPDYLESAVYVVRYMSKEGSLAWSKIVVN